jgi:hypothetical protein
MSSKKKPTALKGGANKLHVIKGDRVKVIAGKDKGIVGEVIAVFPERHKVTVAGVNIAKRHLKDTSGQPQGRSTTPGRDRPPRRPRSTLERPAGREERQRRRGRHPHRLRPRRGD